MLGGLKHQGGKREITGKKLKAEKKVQQCLLQGRQSPHQGGLVNIFGFLLTLQGLNLRSYECVPSLKALLLE